MLFQCFVVASCRSLPAQEKETLKISETALRKEFIAEVGRMNASRGIPCWRRSDQMFLPASLCALQIFFLSAPKTMLILSLSVMKWGAGAALSPDAFPFVRERLVNWTARAVDDIGGPASETRDTPLSSQCLTIPRRGRRAMIPSTEKQSVIYLNW